MNDTSVQPPSEVTILSEALAGLEPKKPIVKKRIPKFRPILQQKSGKVAAAEENSTIEGVLRRSTKECNKIYGILSDEQKESIRRSMKTKKVIKKEDPFRHQFVNKRMLSPYSYDLQTNVKISIDAS